jgi:SAM-dependent methyltransferase
MIRRFLAANSRASAALDRHLPDRAIELYERYDREAAALFPDDPALVAADVGGGRTCSYAHLLPPGPRARLVAVDVSDDELALNTEADETRQADITRGLPFDDRELSFLSSRAVMEHLPDVEGFLRHAHRVLAPGGRTIHLFPGRYALFALAARVLPFDPLKALLHRVYPHTHEVVEFPVFYDRCQPGAFEALLGEQGFDEIEVRVSFNQTDYAAALLPAFVLVALYEAVVRALGLRDLAAYVLVTARRR